MVDVIIYTTRTCPFCRRALQLLDSKDVEYDNIDVTGNQPLRDHMTERAGGRTSVPQTFINGQHIGGCDDLHALDAEGKLDALLRESA